GPVRRALILPGRLKGRGADFRSRQPHDALRLPRVRGRLDFLESIKELKHKDPFVDHVSKPCQNKDYISSINKLLERT
ncbi:MAG: hypothetical protein GY857_03955, partial [Desulfobacula sp.]|nr:hypothetical protein [Desulfobacula sp.]